MSRMLQPKQFEINEAWIAFRLNDAPIRVGRDADFNCIAPMDAASCFMLGTDLVPVGSSGLSKQQSKRLLKTAQSHKDQLPRTLFVPKEDSADLLIAEAAQQNIGVVLVSESELLVFISEARQEFAERFWDSRT